MAEKLPYIQIFEGENMSVKPTPSREVRVTFFKKEKDLLKPMGTYEYKRFPITATIGDVVKWAVSVKPPIADKMAITISQQ